MTSFSNSLQKAFKMLEDAEAYMKENQVMKYIKFLNKEHMKEAGWKEVTLVLCENESQFDARLLFFSLLLLILQTS